MAIVHSVDIKNVPSQVDNAALVLFDGACYLCQSSVQWLLERKTNLPFYFTPLQGGLGKTIKAVLPKNNRESMMVLFQDKLYTEGDAVVFILKNIRRFSVVAFLLNLLPKKILQTLYRWVAQNRQRFLLKNKKCLLPNEKSQALFIAG